MTLLIACLIAGLYLLIFPPKVPRGSLLVALVPVNASTGDCRPDGGAGIAEAYGIPYDDIDSVTWSSKETATAINLKAGKLWAKFEFEPDTAFFNEERSPVGRSNLNWLQTFSMNFTQNNEDVRDASQRLDRQCDMVWFILDNQGQQKLAGIMPKYSNGSIVGTRSLKMRSGQGSVNSAADPSSEERLRVTTFTANSPKEAPYTSVDVSTLAIM